MLARNAADRKRRNFVRSQRTDGRLKRNQTGGGWQSSAGLTDAAADSQAVLLRLKVIPVASAAAVDKLNTATLLSVKEPAGQHGPTRTGLCVGPAHILENTHSLVMKPHTNSL